MIPTTQGSYSFKLDACHLHYSLEGEKPLLTISPIVGYKAIYRSWENLKQLTKFIS